MEVNQEVDKEVTKVVELVNKGLALVCRYGDGHRDDFFKDSHLKGSKRIFDFDKF